MKVRRKWLSKNPADVITAIVSLVHYAPEILKRLGLPTVDHELAQKIIGSGEHAVVFSVSDTKVLKITTDADDAAASEAVRRHGHTRGLVDIYEVYRVARENEDDLYVIVAERVQTFLLGKERSDVDLAILYSRYFIDLDADKISQEDLRRKQKYFSSYKLPPIELVRKFAKDLNAASQTAWKLGFTIDSDIHFGNVGIRNDDELVVIDFGYQSWIRGEKPQLQLAANSSDEMVAVRELLAAPGLLKKYGLPQDQSDLIDLKIGGGSYATVFGINDEIVIKVTRDADDASLAEKVKEAGPLRGVLRVLEVYEGPIKSFFIIAERLKVLPPFESHGWHLEASEDPLMETLRLAMHGEWDWGIEEWKQWAETRPNADARLAMQFKEDVGVGLANLRELGGAVKDIHEWNVGVREGKERPELVILDFGHQSWRRDQERPQLPMARNPNWTKVKKAFEKWFDRVEQEFPDFGKLELHSDAKAHDADRHFAYCKHVGSKISISFAPEAEDLPEHNVMGLMAHEFGHAIDFRYGKAALEKRLGSLPRDVEERADAIANKVFGITIRYDKHLVQCVSCKGTTPRPKGLR